MIQLNPTIQHKQNTHTHAHTHTHTRTHTHIHTYTHIHTCKITLVERLGSQSLKYCPGISTLYEVKLTKYGLRFSNLKYRCARSPTLYCKWYFHFFNRCSSAVSVRGQCLFLSGGKKSRSKEDLYFCTKCRCWFWCACDDDVCVCDVCVCVYVFACVLCVCVWRRLRCHVMWC